MQSWAEPLISVTWWGSLTDVLSNWSQSAAKAAGIQLSVIAATMRRFARVLISVLLLGGPGISVWNALGSRNRGDHSMAIAQDQWRRTVECLYFGCSGKCLSQKVIARMCCEGN